MSLSQLWKGDVSQPISVGNIYSCLFLLHMGDVRSESPATKADELQEATQDFGMCLGTTVSTEQPSIPKPMWLSPSSG
jgi:hypothetical protein